MNRTYSHSEYEDLGAVAITGGIAEDFETDHLLVKLKLRFREIIGKPDKQYGYGVVITEETSKETVFKNAIDLTRVLTKHYYSHVLQYNLPFGKVFETTVLDTLERMAKNLAIEILKTLDKKYGFMGDHLNMVDYKDIKDISSLLDDYNTKV